MKRLRLPFFLFMFFFPTVFVSLVLFFTFSLRLFLLLLFFFLSFLHHGKVTRRELEVAQKKEKGRMGRQQHIGIGRSLVPMVTMT